MRRIATPQITSGDLYRACVSGVGDAHLQAEYEMGFPHVEAQVALYFANAHIGQLCTLTQTNAKPNEDPVVVGGLTKSKLTKLYTNYMVPNDKPARDIYDRLVVSADDKCPFCGGIGHPKTLDHYLPKANFPQYSVLPTNLVPCCRDCNTEKSNAVAVTLGEQTLHPYLDRDHFFSEQWVRASVFELEPVTLHFSAHPPENWSPTDKQRVVTHFKDYGLAKRFGIEAGRELSTLVHLRSNILRGLPKDTFHRYLVDVSTDQTLMLNDWKRVMYQALSCSEWFLSHPF